MPMPISIVDELRYPRRWYTKLLIIILALLFFAGLATVAISGVLTYWIVKPQRTSSEINMASFPGRPDEVDFTVAGLGERKGWFFPGLRGAPTIILLHGYESSRGELLTLVSALQDHQYNAFVFDFASDYPRRRQHLCVSALEEVSAVSAPIFRYFQSRYPADILELCEGRASQKRDGTFCCGQKATLFCYVAFC